MLLRPLFRPFTLFVLLVMLASAGACSLISHKSSAEAASTAPVRIVKLDSTIVNLADTDSPAYLRIAVALSLASPEPKDPSADQAMQSMARDTILNTASTETSGNLLAPGGRQKFKQAILAALQKRLPGAKVTAVYFDDFLVQR